jgi:hypothetical protein
VLKPSLQCDYNWRHSLYGVIKVKRGPGLMGFVSFLRRDSGELTCYLSDQMSIQQDGAAYMSREEASE